jgi:hypothetical protein
MPGIIHYALLPPHHTSHPLTTLSTPLVLHPNRHVRRLRKLLLRLGLPARRILLICRVSASLTVLIPAL